MIYSEILLEFFYTTSNIASSNLDDLEVNPGENKGDVSPNPIVMLPLRISSSFGGWRRKVPQLPSSRQMLEKFSRPQPGYLVNARCLVK